MSIWASVFPDEVGGRECRASDLDADTTAYDSDGDRVEACAPSNYVEPTHAQVVIRLPAKEGTGT